MLLEKTSHQDLHTRISYEQLERDSAVLWAEPRTNPYGVLLLAAYKIMMSDKQQLEQAEARVLYITWRISQNKVMTDERKQWITKMYGPGAVNRIQQYMLAMHKGDMV